MTNLFSSSEAETNVSTRINYFGIILEVTDHDRGSIRNVPQQQPKFSLHHKVSSLLCSYKIIILQIKMLKYMCISMIITLVSPPKLQVNTEGV